MWKCTGMWRSEHTAQNGSHVVVGEVGRAEVGGVGRHVHAARAEGGDALGLGDARVDAPRRHQRQAEEPVAGVGLDAGHVVVVRLDDDLAEVFVVDHPEVLATETDGVREHDLRVDAALVEHPRRTFGSYDPTCVSSIAPVVEREVGALLQAVPADHRAGAGAAERVAVEHPRGDVVDHLDVRARGPCTSRARAR